jgi:ABC-type multidrug transport system ATPase subunit
MIELNHVGLKIGDKQILHDINVQIPKGAIVGIVGANGAGKSSLLKVIGGVYNTYTTGKISMDTLLKCSYISDDKPLYHHLSGYENLTIYAYMNRISVDRLYIDILLSEVGFNPADANTRVSRYSLGMKQKILIACMFLKQPDVILMDEPFNGLDNVSTSLIQKFISTQSSAGKTFLISSHLVEELKKICTHIIQMEKGQVLAYSSIKKYFTDKNDIMVMSSNNQLLIQELDKYKVISYINHQDIICLKMNEAITYGMLFHAAKNAGVEISYISTH